MALFPFLTIACALNFGFGSAAVIRVEIDTMPALLRSIVHAALSGHKDFLVDATPPDPDGGETGNADVLIVCGDREPFNRLSMSGLTGERPPAVVAIDTDGESASILHVIAEHRRLDAASDLGQIVRHAFLARRETMN